METRNRVVTAKSLAAAWWAIRVRIFPFLMLARFVFLFAAVIAVALPSSAAQPFIVVVYNTENLHDADGVAVYDDYQPEFYTPRHLATKLENIARLLGKFGGGAGPDVVLLQEVEIDQTPDTTIDPAAFLTAHREERFDALLERAAAGDEMLRGVPAEVWLLKALADHGIGGYHLAVGSDAPATPGEEMGRAIKCVTLSKFPIRAVHEYPIESARNVLETELEVGGNTLHVLNTHWKSGAGDAALETVRIQNATVLRARVDAILAQDAAADILIGGDFNSHYNQRPRYAEMPRTAVNDVLQAQGSELALQSGAAVLYDLWYELEPALRGSDVYRGEWGTLMHLVVSRGLYDGVGTQYLDNSFQVARAIGFNADAAGAPVRWSSGGPGGGGFSDHLPIYTQFRAVEADADGAALTLENPSDETPTADVWRVNYAAVDVSAALDPKTLPEGSDLRDGSWTGKLFKVSGMAMADGRDLRVRVAGAIFDVYAPERAVHTALLEQHAENRRFSFVGELGIYKGSWQFVVRDITWVQ